MYSLKFTYNMFRRVYNSLHFNRLTFEMGKGKNQKRKVNVFKVSSGRSAKAKNKIKLDVNRKNVSNFLRFVFLY